MSTQGCLGAPDTRIGVYGRATRRIMTLTCPCCHASNDTAVCRRCKADLSLLVAMENRREYHVTLAKRFAAEGRYTEALRHINQATQLRPTADMTQFRAALHLLGGEFAAALRAYDGAV